MTSKAVLYKRICTAIGEEIAYDQFRWFFKSFCEVYDRPDLVSVKQLSNDDVLLFSQYAQYDLRFDNPTPIDPQI